jgi:hypothetical protein
MFSVQVNIQRFNINYYAALLSTEGVSLIIFTSCTRTPLQIENALVGVAGTVPDKIVLDLSIRK